MNKRAIIFDFGGVLMKTRDYRPRHSWDDQLGLPHGSVERVVHGSQNWQRAQTGQLSLQDYWASVARDLRLSQTQVQQLAEDFYSGDQLDHQLIQYIKQLRADDHPVALLSNDSPALTDRLRALAIDSLFDPIIISAHIGVMKPDERTYQAVLNALQRPAGATVFIDDMPTNIEGADALGIHGIRYSDGMDLESALKSLLTIAT